jgi:hypothetical protein
MVNHPKKDALNKAMHNNEHIEEGMESISFYFFYPKKVPKKKKKLPNLTSLSS